ncbi:hypothetical protein EI94DRAFT_1726310, partial [Lactarius quietus]
MRISSDCLRAYRRTRVREIRRHTHTQSHFLRLRRTKIGLRNFRKAKVIGKGEFGEVRLAQKIRPWRCGRDEDSTKSRNTQTRPSAYYPDLFTITDVHRVRLAHVRVVERDDLADSTSSWVVQVYYSFQDPYICT